ncbi:MAG: TerD family protein, partial [Campylobacterota bacterium]|nr:TerD family protein [Campylobacterota bacterium]
AATGVLSGLAGASTVAGLVGGGGIFSSILGGVGLTVVAATPVGWLIGGAALGGAVFLGGSKLIGAKGVSDGDINAHRTFNSDLEKQKYMKISSKLNSENSIIAYNLIDKLPLEYEEFKEDMRGGISNGTVPIEESIKLSCEILGENEDKYIKEYKEKYSLIEIELVIKIALLLIVKEDTTEKRDLIRKEVIDFFNLSSVLIDEEIDIIFSQAIGTQEQQKQLKDISVEEIQTMLLIFFISINDEKLKNMLVDFLLKIIKIDYNSKNTEQLLYNIFIGLLKSEENMKNYNGSLNKFKKIKSKYFYSSEIKDKEAYKKKLEGALKTYVSGLNGENVISLYDSTTFGSGEDGFVVTDLAIITNQASENRIIPLGSIDRVIIHSNSILFFNKGKHNKMNQIAELKCNIDKIDEFQDLLFDIIQVNKNKEDTQQKPQLINNNERLKISIDINSKVTLDTAMFLLGKDDKVLSDNHLIFFNNKSSICKSINLNDNVIDIDLREIEKAIQKIVFILITDDTSEDINNLSIKIKNSKDKDIIEYKSNNTLSQEKALHFCELYQEDGNWDFKFIDNSSNSNLEDFCNIYGVNIS